MFTEDEYKTLDGYFDGDSALERWFYSNVEPDWRTDYVTIDALIDAANEAIIHFDAEMARY